MPNFNQIVSLLELPVSSWFVLLAIDWQNFLLVAVGTDQHDGYVAGRFVELGLQAQSE